MDPAPLLPRLRDVCARAGFSRAGAVVRLLEDRAEEARRAEGERRDSLLFAMQRALGVQFQLETLRVHETVEEAGRSVARTHETLETLVRDVSLGLTLPDAADALASLQAAKSSLEAEKAQQDISERALQYCSTELLEKNATSLFLSPFLVAARVSSATTCEAVRTVAALELLQDALVRLKASQGERLGELESRLADDLELVRSSYTASLEGLSRRLAGYGEGETRQRLREQGRRARRAEAEARDVAALLVSLAPSYS